MRRAIYALATLSVVWLAGCTSPEAERKRGGGPGADVGNRSSTVEMHGQVDMFHKTPRKLSK